MESVSKISVAVLAGAVLGIAAIHALHAQAKAPVYAIVEVSEITDKEGFRPLNTRSDTLAASNFQEFGGRYLARTDKITALEGPTPARFVIIHFDTVEKAQAWYNSPSQTEVNAVRNKRSKSRAFVVQGM